MGEAAVGLGDYVCQKLKLSPPPFLAKTYMLVEDPTTNHIISWNNDGRTFVVWQPSEFATHLLPTLFKHSNFSSFVRQLNTYGFRKSATSQWEFCNDKFQKGKKERICEIRRRKAYSSKLRHNSNTKAIQNANQDVVEEDTRSSSTSSSSDQYITLIDENKRLKMENGVLSIELTNMKKKCQVLLDLVTKYEFVINDNKKKEDETTKKKKKKKKLHLKLFGVKLEVGDEDEMAMKNKRKR